MSDIFYPQQVDYIFQLNALWDRATTSVIGTSTSSLSISTGSKSFTTNTNLQFAVGSQVTITATADLSKYMSGQVTAYTQSTGAITVNVASTSGSGTFSSWSITLSGAAGAKGDKGDTGDTGATGATGAAGAPNVLSIGTVTSSGTASATITGTSPAQVLNLVLPKGDTGATGAAGAKGVNPRGNWSAGTAYAVDDLAYYSGSTWRRLIAGTTATAPSSDATNWEIFAQKGADGAGTVAGVTASAPLASTGGATPNITITQSNTSTDGYLSSADWNTFNGKAPLVSPSFTTPSLGVASATSVNKVAITAPATSATITIANGKTFTSSNTLTFTGTDGSTLNVGSGGTLGTAAYTASTAYAPAAGSTSVTTLGTVGTGTWNAGVIAGQYGGTGVANTGKTITLGGNLTTSGAFASTFTMTATTAVTFPASGTLLSTAAAVTVAQGGTGLTALTAGSVLVGNGTSNPTLVAPSIAGNVLTSDGTTWFSAPAAGGAGSWIPLAQVTVSASTSLDVDTVFTSTYDRYVLLYTDIFPSTDAQDIYVQVKTSGSYITTGYECQLRNQYANTTTFASTGGAGIGLKVAGSPSGGGISNAASSGTDVNFWISKPSSTTRKKTFKWDGVGVAGGGSLVAVDSTGFGAYTGSTAAITGFRLLAQSGNISGTVRVYGIKNS